MTSSAASRPNKRRRTQDDVSGPNATDQAVFLYIKGTPDDGVASALSTARTTSLLCDAELQSSDGLSSPQPAHRVLLASRSGYMRALLETPTRFADSSDMTIRLVDISSKSLGRILDWMYGQDISLTTLEDAIDLAEAASRLECSELLEVLCDFLKKKVGRDTCVAFWTLAERCGSDILAERAELVTARHFEDLVNNGEMLAELSADLMIRLVSRTLLPVDSEEKVFAAITSWAKGQDEDVLESNLATLVAKVRFRFLSADFVAENEPLLAKYSISAAAIAQDQIKSNLEKRTKWLKKTVLIEDLIEGLLVRLTSDTEKLKRLVGSCGYNWKHYGNDYAGTQQQIVRVARFREEVQLRRLLWPVAALDAVDFCSTCDCVQCSKDDKE